MLNVSLKDIEYIWEFYKLHLLQLKKKSISASCLARTGFNTVRQYYTYSLEINENLF